MHLRIGTLAVALLMAAGMFASWRPAPVAHADSNPPAPQSTGADPQSMKDGCGRDPLALLSRREPEWAYVYDTPSSQPAPAPRWVAGTVSADNPRFAAVHVSGGDLPTGHLAYDYSVNVLADPGYTYLLGGDPVKKTGNYTGFDEASGRLHTEWEDLTVPKFAWAEPGDHVLELGSWVWDCGHWGPSLNIFAPDYFLPKVGQPCFGIPDPNQCVIIGEGTEFHPYRAVWVQRKQPVTATQGESQADLFVSTDATLAGNEANCSHQFKPSFATANQALNQAQYKACLDTTTPWQDVSGDYSFLLPAPPRPTPTARLVFHAVDQGSSGGVPTPKLTAEGDAVRVTFHLSTPDATHPLKMGYSFYAGWDTLPLAQVPNHLKVVFDKLVVHRSQDPNCPLGAPVSATCASESTRTETLATTGTFTNAGQWNLYFDAQGSWGQFTVNDDGQFDPTDGTTLPLTQSADIYVPQGKGWRLFVHGRECDLGDLAALTVDDQTKARGIAFADCPRDHDLGTDNDVPGFLIDSYGTAAASVGPHQSDGLTHKADPTSTCPDSNLHGCYTLYYHVSAVDDAAARALNPSAADQLPPTGAVPGAVPLALAAVALVLLAAGIGLRSLSGRSGQPD
ncbi:MAG: hypothetical protein ABR573_04175 [Candidatus Dormibacteria bacterium]